MPFVCFVIIMTSPKSEQGFKVTTYHYIPLHTPLHTITHHYIPLRTIAYHYIPSYRELIMYGMCVFLSGSITFASLFPLRKTRVASTARPNWSPLPHTCTYRCNLPVPNCLNPLQSTSHERLFHSTHLTTSLPQFRKA